MSKLKEILKGAGMTDALINDLVVYNNLEEGAAHPVDDFDLNQRLSSWKGEVTEIAITNAKEKIEKEYEERVKGNRYKDITKPFLNRLKRAGEFDEEEIKGKKLKEILDLYITKQNERIAAVGTEGVEVYVTKIAALQSKEQEYLELLESSKAEHEAALLAAEQKAQQSIYDSRADRYLVEKYQSKDMTFDLDDKRGLYLKIHGPELKKLAKITNFDTGEIIGHDGQMVQRLGGDGDGYYKTAEELIKALAIRDKVWKLSNGSEGAAAQNLGHGQATTIVGGKTVDRAKSNKLKEYFSKKK